MKLPNMAADSIKGRIDYDIFKKSIQQIEIETKFLQECIEFYHKDNELFKEEAKELIEATTKLMDVFGIKPVREKD